MDRATHHSPTYLPAATRLEMEETMDSMAVVDGDEPVATAMVTREESTDSACVCAVVLSWLGVSTRVETTLPAHAHT